ncbi:peptide-N4-(N-acetyl-beta-glucosaminyl)asparagine amidase A-like [Olea europaea var. sylvestris]|uniref:peptide-N4-(N-acetyl-beta- glucosaminyl)asparagine amidase A-like n=1 Tax=Olea europaea var. sylvestris TaxID=158386 RepID=UPI000C1D48F9|nr:peptide-N4-(N-acetyl-beta-glucosaminyl)asparagine amidase A-like [Olea europaea var. sylvestris]
MVPPPFILLFVTFLIRISSSSALVVKPQPPLRHQSRFTKHNCHIKNYTSGSYQQYFEITHPLPFDNLIPSCTLPVFSYDVHFIGPLPPINVEYFPPANCTWTNVTLHLIVASNISRYDPIVGVWLDGAEILRSSTAESTAGDGIFWEVRKDITRYTSILRQEKRTLTVVLGNVVNFNPGLYRLKLDFLYYDTDSNKTDTDDLNILWSPSPKISSSHREHHSLDIYERPADLIIPIAGNGDEGHWFKIESDFDVKSMGIQIPSNTYKAVIEVYVSFHGDDEFWYSNPPDAYIKQNDLDTKRGHGAYREVMVTLDENVYGSVVPFPVIFSDGINPLFWEPVVAIGAFNLPSYDFELTPFLGMLLDGKVHNFGLKVADAISFWLVDANLHLWLDDNMKEVQAMGIEYSLPNLKLERESKFHELDGTFEIEAKRKSEFSGWVNSSIGNLTTIVYQKLNFENTIELDNCGTEKVVKQEVKVKREVRVKSSKGDTISRTNLERKFPLKITTKTLVGLVKNTYLMTTKLEHSLKEEKSNEDLSSSLSTRQECTGWVFVKDNDVLSGAATTQQRYTYKDDNGCYSKRVTATDGVLSDDSSSLLCASSL